MATIGAFKKQADGSYSGALKTLDLEASSVHIRPAAADADKAPDYRIFCGEAEVGAAWKRTSREQRDYLSVKLDDPSFPAPIYASLVETPETSGGGYSLIWSRSRSAD